MESEDKFLVGIGLFIISCALMFAGTFGVNKWLDNNHVQRMAEQGIVCSEVLDDGRILQRCEPFK
jgi:hypothetical protein